MKKATGIVRRIDDLGRIVVPKELRRTFDLPEGAPVEIFVDDENIILHKYAVSCVFCGEQTDLIDVEGKGVCPGCIRKIQRRRLL